MALPETGYNFTMEYKQKGFTVIELMIAIAVFTIAVLLVAAATMFIARNYTQAKNRVAIEEATRQLHSDIANSIIFSGSSSAIVQANDTKNLDWDTLCVGNIAYTWSGVDLLDDKSNLDDLQDGLYQKNIDSSCEEPDSSISLLDQGYTNVLPERAKVAKLNVAQIGSPDRYIIETNIFSGDISQKDMFAVNSGAVKCNSAVTGREWCAAVTLTSSATRRIN